MTLEARKEWKTKVNSGLCLVCDKPISKAKMSVYCSKKCAGLIKGYSKEKHA